MKKSLKLPQKLMLLGSGELGKEFTIAAQRLGNYVIAVDRYHNAPAMQVANESEVISMLSPDQLEASFRNTNLILLFLKLKRSEQKN
jgi:phosphoribosylglycinamide formyltransferase 2